MDQVISMMLFSTIILSKLTQSVCNMNHIEATSKHYPSQ